MDRFSRRRFVAGLAGVPALGLAGQLPAASMIHNRHYAKLNIQTDVRQQPVGSDYALSVGALPVNYTGRPANAVAINGGIPGPLLRWRQGQTVTLRVANRLGVDTSIHWHGILLPSNMDGVPGLSFHGIRPGEAFAYKFTLKQAGTYWYHAHSSLQEAKGVYGAIVIEPDRPDPAAADRDYVLLLSDWSDEDPHAIVRKLKIQSDYYNRHKRTVGDFIRDARRDGLGATLNDRGMWGRMRMSPTDLADVNGLTYTFLVNGTTPAGNWTGLFKRGERVRLRFINGSAMTYFDVRIPGLEMTVVAADGQPVHPVSIDEFRIGVAETLDVVVTPMEDQPYTVFAQATDRSGYARATLAPRIGLEAPVPALDPRPILTMADMGHGDHAGHDMSGHAMKMDASEAPRSTQPAAVSTHDHEAMNHGGMDHAAMDHAAMGHATPGHAAMDHSMHGAGDSTAAMVSHPASETGNPAVDMQTMTPSRALDDPGIGLRGNGRRVLAYADLKSDFDDPDPREPSRTVELHLTGNMERYVWGFDGIRFSEAEPIRLNHGERMRIVLVNDTMMEHPIHLHGLWSDLEDESGAFHLRKHTISVPPGHVRSYRVSADAIGRWAYHCHMLLHMELGMFREVRVE
ncbi:MAG TPA: copper resistance system multicopper oxidase [Luteimonas sp.]|nr:copper resistance system multicopper oxidase [Luteimonas sp.]